MSQFFAYQNTNPRSCAQYPYLLDIQTNLLSDLGTTLVIPLMPSSLAAPIRLSKLNPELTLDGKSFTAMTQDMAGMNRKQLGAAAFDLTEHRAEILAAIDFMLSGI